jgi:hypothetical protein
MKYIQESNSPGKLKRKIILYLVMLAIILGAIECISFAYFSFFHNRYTFFNSKNYVLPIDDIARAKSAFNAELGWDRYYNTTYGER